MSGIEAATSTPWTEVIDRAIALVEAGDSAGTFVLAETCLAADTTSAEFALAGRPGGRPPGRPMAVEVRTAARALGAAVRDAVDGPAAYQRIVALMFATWSPQMLAGTGNAYADIERRAEESATALDLARTLDDEMLLAWAMHHHGRSLRHVHNWTDALTYLRQAADLAADPAGPGAGPFAATRAEWAESAAILRQVITCRSLKYMSEMAVQLGDMTLWRTSLQRMVMCAEQLVPVRPSLLAEALAKQGALARHVGDRDGFRAVEDRLHVWAEQSGVHRARRAWLTEAACNAEHLQDRSRAYELHRRRAECAVEGLSLSLGDSGPAALSAVVTELERRGLRGRRIALGNAAYDCAVQIWKSGRTATDPDTWAEAGSWLDLAERAWRHDGRNGLAAVAFTRARLLAEHPTNPDPLRAADEALHVSENGLRGGLRVNTAAAAASWCAPGDQRVIDRLTHLLGHATPRHRAVLNHGSAVWHERHADHLLATGDTDAAIRHYNLAEANALASAAELEIDGVIVDMATAAQVWAIAARVCGRTGRIPRADVPATVLERLLHAVRCVAELFITVSDLAERQGLGRMYGDLFRETADLAVSLGDTAAADLVMEAVRRDRVGFLITALARDPAVSAAVRRAAEGVLAASAAQPSVPTADSGPKPPEANETRALTCSAEAISMTRARSRQHADRILGVLGALADGRALPNIGAQTVLNLCPGSGTTALLQLMASHVGVLGATSAPRTLYRRLTWRDEAGAVHEHLDVVPLTFDPKTLTPEQAGYWQVLPRLTDYLLPKPLQHLLADRERPEPPRLMIVPTGLFDIAFDALPLDDERHLLDAAVVSVHASLTTMAHLLTRAALPPPQPSIAVYDKVRLAHAEWEWEALESHIGPLRNIAERAVLMRTLGGEETAEYRMLALAVHGIDDDSDGWGQAKLLPDGFELTAAEAMALSFPQLCVLASCHSSVRLRGGVELAGFPLALFARGASTVIGSLHEIDDESTARIMRRFWAELGRGTDPVRALRSAKLNWLDTEPDKRLTPRLWGGLVALGGAHL